LRKTEGRDIRTLGRLLLDAYPSATKFGKIRKKKRLRRIFRFPETYFLPGARKGIFPLSLEKRIKQQKTKRSKKRDSWGGKTELSKREKESPWKSYV